MYCTRARKTFTYGPGCEDVPYNSCKHLSKKKEMLIYFNIFSSWNIYIEINNCTYKPYMFIILSLNILLHKSQIELS